MGVDGVAVTSAEAAQYRAPAGGRTPRCLRVERNAASTPDKPAYIDFSPESPDRVLTWSAFDNAATNLAHRLLALGVAAGDGVAVWHKDTSAIHVLLVAIERCGAIAVGRGTRGRARGDGDSSDRAPDVSWSAMSNGSPRLSEPPLTPTRRYPPWRSATADLSIDTATRPPTPDTACPPSGLTTSS